MVMLDDFQDDEPVKNSDFLDEFRQRLNSQPLENIEERKKEISKSQHIFLGTILGVGLAGIASWFILSPDYKKTENIDIPVVRRANTAIKVQPANPGGMEILNQDKSVYDIVEKNADDNLKVENILPPTEEPILPAVAQNIEAKTQEAVAQSNNAIKAAETIIATEEKKDTPKAEVKKEIKKEIKVEVVEESTSMKPSVADVKTTVEEPAKEAKPVVEKTPEKSPEKIEKVSVKEETSTLAASGKWQIQLISSPNKAAMEKSWIDLTKKYNQLKDLPHEIESADLGAKGTFYRLKAGAFSTRGEADKLCNSIKTAGGSCLVKKKQ